MNTSKTDNQITSIAAPFGYGEIVPVLKTHKVLATDGQVPQALRESNAIPLTMSEIPRAARDYPVVFASADEGKSFGVVALLGLNERENLFVGSDGKWRDDVYLPAYLRRYPFCMATVTRNGQAGEERIVCVERSMLDDQRGLPLERQGEEKLSWWSERLHLLQEYEADLLRTRHMCDTLKKLGILERFNAQAVSAQGEVMNLGGMYRADEQRLEALKADDLRMLIRKGIMGRLYAHMISLDNLGRLLDMK
jgi:hypothetical protein